MLLQWCMIILEEHNIEREKMSELCGPRLGKRLVWEGKKILSRMCSSVSCSQISNRIYTSTTWKSREFVIPTWKDLTKIFLYCYILSWTKYIWNKKKCDELSDILIGYLRGGVKGRDRERIMIQRIWKTGLREWKQAALDLEDPVVRGRGW